MRSTKRFIVSADDFAFNAAVDDGILALVEAGLVTATSCLTASPRWPVAARRINSAVRARADIGVHLDLTEFEHPAPNHASLVLACYTRSVDRGTLRAMIRTQLQRFEDQLADPPDYIDGHRHVHQLPVVRDVLLELLAERYPRRLPWVRVSRAGAGAGWKGQLVTWLGADGLSARCHVAGVSTNPRLLGFYDFKGDSEGYRRRLAAWVAAAEDRDVLMCHPAARIAEADPIASARRAEFEAMCTPWWRACLDAHLVTLCRGAACKLT